jgi:ligand-binding sensor domain-containing protein
MRKTCLLTLLLSVFACRGQNIISGGIRDRMGNLWFAVSDRGVYRFDGKSFTNFSKKDSLCDNRVSCIFEDRSGILWFGTNSGVCRFDGKRFTDFPLSIVDTTTIRPFKKSFSQSPKNVCSILQDKAGNFWFVTLHHGVFRYNGKFFINFLSHEVLLCISEDKQGKILVGSWRHGGVYSFDGKTFTNLSGFSDDMIFCMLKDKFGNVWVGTRDHGVDRFDGKFIINFSEKDGLMDTNVSCLFEDSKGNIWMGSDVRSESKGGDVFCYNGRSFTNITANESLRRKNGLVYGVRTIVEDDAGNIWVGSKDGSLHCYDGKNFIDFSEKVSK